MTDREKQIKEEITENTIRKYVESDKVYMINDELEMLIQYLGYRKIPEGAVVLTQEEYNSLLKVNSELAVLGKSIPMLTAQASKETAEKILTGLYETKFKMLGEDYIYADNIKVFAKQYGVDIEE